MWSPIYIKISDAIKFIIGIFDNVKQKITVAYILNTVSIYKGLLCVFF